jgi:DNA-directed RNA polymerase specialized sigma24 family protein
VLLELSRERSRHELLGDNDSKVEAAPPAGLTAEDRERCMDAVMTKLPRASKALLQAMLKGRENSDIAELLGIKLNALYQRQHNCYKAVRELMKSTPECEGICHA